jgi:hypothetical protein
VLAHQSFLQDEQRGGEPADEKQDAANPENPVVGDVNQTKSNRHAADPSLPRSPSDSRNRYDHTSQDGNADANQHTLAIDHGAPRDVTSVARRWSI